MQQQSGRDRRDDSNAGASSLRRDRLAAIITGLLGALMAILSGFLPVHQDVAEFTWTPGDDFESVTAPLVSGRPVALGISIPCQPAAEVSEGTVLLSTLPDDAPGQTSDGLVVQRSRTADGTPSLEIAVRNHTLFTIPVQRLREPECQRIAIHADTGVLEAEAEGLTYTSGDEAGEPFRSAVPGSMRPQVVGVFSDLDASDDPAATGLSGMTAHVTVDSRYSSSPTVLKVVLILVGVAATLASLFYLGRLDRADGRRHRRFVPSTWRKLSPVDGVVITVLSVWHLIGANTSDDGYLLTMARSAGPSGYMANYYRWLGAPESPVGWYYEILKLLSEVSTASPWMRLPSLLFGIVAWLIISREVVPRFGVLARRWTSPQWTGAAVFLAFWLAFNNGLRPEPVIALGALLTWSLIERSIATRRILPAAVAVGVAAFSVGTGPTGLMCVAALAAGLRPLLKTLRARARVIGWLPLLAPVLAVGLSLLFTVFADQTFATVLEATRIRTDLGPSLPWYDEKNRWEALFGTDADGGLSRRMPVLLMLMCLGLVVAVLLRRGRIPGVATGPAVRLIGVVSGSLFLLVFTPTKWTHHFGVFAGLGGALAVLAILALRRASISSSTNRWLVGAVLAGVVGLGTATNNSWWYVSDYGMPFADEFPHIGGVYINQIAFIVCLASIVVAGLIHAGVLPDRPLYSLWQLIERYLPFRVPRRLRPMPDTPAAREVRVGNRYPGGSIAPLTVVAFALVAFEVASTLTAVVDRAPAYTVGRANTRALMGEPCSMGDSVLVEEDSNDGILEPIGATPDIALSAGGSSGFAPNGVPDIIDVTAELTDSDSVDDTAADADDSATTDGAGAEAGVGAGEAGGQDLATGPQAPGGGGGATAGQTAAGVAERALATEGLGPDVIGGRGRRTINGSTVALPFGLDPDTTSVMGSYRRANQVEASLRSSWYELPARSENRPLLVMAVAGRVGPQSVRIEYGRPGDVGPHGPTSIETTGSIPLSDVGEAPAWRNLRLPLESIPEDAEMVRIVATDNNLSPDWWLAVTPPRNPQLRTLDEVVGRETPVLIDWVVALAFPCQQPFRHNNGVAEIPHYRILPDQSLRGASNWWQRADGGGPLMWMEQTLQPVTVPTYLDHDWNRDWGTLQRYFLLENETSVAEIDHSVSTQWGWQSPGPMY